MAMVLVANNVQFKPLVEMKLEKRLLLLESFIQQFVRVDPETVVSPTRLVLEVDPPVLARVLATIGPFPCRATNMYRDPVAVLSRIIIPAYPATFVLL